MCQNLWGTLGIEETEDSYVVVVTVDGKWLADVGGVYPVVIDPSVSRNSTSLTADKATIKENGTKDTATTLNVGRDGNGANRAFWKPNLPDMQGAGQVVSAYLNFYKSNSTSMDIYVHKVIKDWTSSSISWSSHGTAGTGYSTLVEEFRTISSASIWKFDITDMANEWYKDPGANYGLMFKAANETTTAMTTFTTDTTSTYLTVTFVNNEGLESYWSNESFSLGRGGDVFVNHFNGNMVWTNSLVTVPGNSLPISVGLVYNHSQRTNQYPVSGRMRFGKGMRLNVSQTIEKKTLGGTEYILMVDSDGTTQYFKYSTTDVYVHENNSALKITKSGTEYIVTDDTKNKIFFTDIVSLPAVNGAPAMSKGFLKKIQDGNGCTQTYTYNTNWQLTEITDRVGRKITFTWGSTGCLDKITDAAGRTITLGYAIPSTYNESLGKITYTDGAITSVAYSGDNITTIIGPNKTQYKQSYSSPIPSRVTKMSQWNNTGTAEGSYVAFEAAYFVADYSAWFMAGEVIPGKGARYFIPLVAGGAEKVLSDIENVRKTQFAYAVLYPQTYFELINLSGPPSFGPIGYVAKTFWQGFFEEVFK